MDVSEFVLRFLERVSINQLSVSDIFFVLYDYLDKSGELESVNWRTGLSIDLESFIFMSNREYGIYWIYWILVLVEVRKWLRHYLLSVGRLGRMISLCVWIANE